MTLLIVYKQGNRQQNVTIQVCFRSIMGNLFYMILYNTNKVDLKPLDQQKILWLQYKWENHTK